jgi:hypothetical protein
VKIAVLPGNLNAINFPTGMAFDTGIKRDYENDKQRVNKRRHFESMTDVFGV